MRAFLQRLLPGMTRDHPAQMCCVEENECSDFVRDGPDFPYRMRQQVETGADGDHLRLHLPRQQAKAFHVDRVARWIDGCGMSGDATCRRSRQDGG